MVIGILTLHLSIPHAASLKDKRRAVRGLKEKLKHRFNVSAAEVDDHEIWTRATIGVTTVGPDRTYLEGQLQQVVNFANNHPEAVLDDTATEFLHR
jgi:uncharacterized protein YlxP (DUF503 family)